MLDAYPSWVSPTLYAYYAHPAKTQLIAVDISAA